MTLKRPLHRAKNGFHSKMYGSVSYGPLLCNSNDGAPLLACQNIWHCCDARCKNAVYTVSKYEKVIICLPFNMVGNAIHFCIAIHIPAFTYNLAFSSAFTSSHSCNFFFLFDDHILQNRTILLCPQVHLFIVREKKEGVYTSEQPSWHCPNFIAVFVT